MRYSVVCIGLMGLLGLRQVDTEITIYTTGELVIRIYPGLLIVKIYFAMSRFSTSSLRLENSPQRSRKQSSRQGILRLPLVLRIRRLTQQQGCESWARCAFSKNRPRDEEGCLMPRILWPPLQRPG